MIKEPVKPKKKDQIWLDEEAKINVDHQLAERLQAQEQEELSDEENDTLFQQLLKKRRKYFAAKRAELKRNKPPIKEMFDKAFRRVNTFEDFRTELVEGKEKRAGEELVQETTKKQKIVDWKIHKEGKKSYYQIVKADGKSQMYMVFSQMLKSFDMEDLEDLYKLVKAKYESKRLVEDLDLLLWGDLKTMFEPHIEDEVWKKQQGYKVLSTFLEDAICADLYVGREEVSPYTTYTFNNVGKET
ncbi:hypothetical protein Tco_0179256 [Tanacetum coccineum]